MEGYQQVKHRNLTWHIFVSEKKSGRLVVMLNGARRRTVVPGFNRWSWYPMLEDSMLCIDDPMYLFHHELLTDWYYGNKEEDYCEYAAELVRAYAAAKGIRQVIFYGSSNGGNAALRCAARVPGSMVAAINPLIDLTIHSLAPNFQRQTGVTLDRTRADTAPIAMGGSVKSLLMFNTRSVPDMVQLRHLLQYAGIADTRPLHKGLNAVTDTLLLWLYDAVGVPKPHTSQDWPSIFGAIFRLVDAFERDTAPNLANTLGGFYAAFSDLWSDYFALRAEISSETPDDVILIGAEAGKDGITVRWRPFGDVDGYWVYRKTEGARWERIAKTTDTVLLDRDAKHGIRYIYTVRAVSGTKISRGFDVNGVSAVR